MRIKIIIEFFNRFLLIGKLLRKWHLLNIKGNVGLVMLLLFFQLFKVLLLCKESSLILLNNNWLIVPSHMETLDVLEVGQLMPINMSRILELFTNLITVIKALLHNVKLMKPSQNIGLKIMFSLKMIVMLLLIL